MANDAFFVSFCSRACVLSCEEKSLDVKRANASDSESAYDTEDGDDDGNDANEDRQQGEHDSKGSGGSTDEQGSEEVDVDGTIPEEVEHSLPAAFRDDVWQYVHVLRTPQKRGKKRCRNICLLCVDNALKKKRVPETRGRKGSATQVTRPTSSCTSGVSTASTQLESLQSMKPRTALARRSRRAAKNWPGISAR